MPAKEPISIVKKDNDDPANASIGFDQYIKNLESLNSVNFSIDKVFEKVNNKITANRHQKIMPKYIGLSLGAVDAKICAMDHINHNRKS